MAEYRILTEFPGDMLERIAGFYLAAHWISPGGDAGFLGAALAGSFRVVGAFEAGRLVGVARALSDGCSDAYIQDVVVDPACRGRGIGAGLVRFLTAELRRCGVDWIALVGEPGTEMFYRRMGWMRQDGFVMWKAPEM